VAALARLDQRINWERRDRSAGMRVSVDPMRELLRLLDHPERSARCVQVAGSKGKGSVAALIAAGLSASGRRVGCYASPHVDRMHERIRIDGEQIGDAPFADALELVLAAREAGEQAGSDAAEASWFDLVTATALVAFRAAHVDWIVLEVGLGGRLDSTNAVTTELGVITNIELEHTSVLGHTRAKIAFEKAGILKPGTRAAVTPLDPDDEAGSVIQERADEVGVPLTRVRVPQGATIEAENIATARTALSVLATLEPHRSQRPLGADLLDDEVCKRARLPGRLEIVQREKLSIVLDGAHVATSLTRLLDELAAWDARPPVVVLALGRDKEAEACLKALAGRVDRVVCTSIPSGVHRSATELGELARTVGIETEVIAGVEDAFESACSAASDAWVLVTGSLYLVGAVRAHLSVCTTGNV